jgi:hypothetical protein
MDVLVIGRKIEVLENVRRSLIAKGIAVDGTTSVERASVDFDARNFTLVAFGGGVDHRLRERLKGDFIRQNPDVILLDTFAPVAVQHITAALRGSADKHEFASRFEITEDDGSYLMHLDLKKECDVCVDVYDLNDGFHRTTLGKGHLSAGPFVFKIHQNTIRVGMNIIVVTLNSNEFYFHRIER